MICHNNPLQVAVGDHFHGSGGEFVVTGVTASHIFYEEVGNESLEGTAIERKRFGNQVRNGTIRGQRKESLKEKAMRLIDTFCISAFKSRADFSDMTRIPIGYTTVEDEDIPIQIYANLENRSISRFVMGVLVETLQYHSLKEFIETELEALNFDELVFFTEEQINTAVARWMDDPIPLNSKGAHIYEKPEKY